jgi:hypothetical protein
VFYSFQGKLQLGWVTNSVLIIFVPLEHGEGKRWSFSGLLKKTFLLFSKLVCLVQFLTIISSVIRSNTSLSGLAIVNLVM